MSSNIPLMNITEQSTDQNPDKELYVSHKKIYVRSVSGFFQAMRKYSLSVLLLMYFSFAWISVDERPLVLFDLEAQKFNLFGMVFWPQDFTLLAFALIIAAFGLFFVTTLFGRIWCGYSCPQTAWTFIFIWLEEFFEGSRQQRIKLDNAPYNMLKIAKKMAKYLSWFIVSLATALTFVAYFVPTQELFISVLTFSLDSSLIWFWIIFFTSATYINAGWLREQVCIYMCPYARFQSVMFNENTKIVGYDEARGEPRGSRSRKVKASDLGDCVDCQLCVQVCPVGIDIRDGLQYECIGCALCIDACDSVMDKMNYAKGLIRYASETEFNTGKKSNKFDIRAVAYGILLLCSVGIFIQLMIDRPLAELSAIKDRGALFNMNGLGQIENNYTLKLVNKQKTEDVFNIFVEGMAVFELSENKVTVGPGEVKNIPITVVSEPAKLKQSANKINFNVLSVSDKNIYAEAESKFIAPIY